MNDFLQLARDRYSVRSFDPSRPVTDEQVDSIVKAALYAPTAVNNQPFRILVLKSKEAREKAVSCTKMKFIGDAPVIFAVGAKPDEAWVRQYDSKNFAEIDAAIVSTQIMLQIHALGLGSTWIGHFDAPMFKEVFPEMKDTELIALFPAGYPSDEAAPSPRHELSRPEDELVTVL